MDVSIFVQTELLFDDIRTEERLLQDTTEIQIQTKYLDISCHIIHIFFCKKSLYEHQFVTINNFRYHRDT